MVIEEVNGFVLVNGFNIDEYSEDGRYKIRKFIQKVLNELS